MEGRGSRLKKNKNYSALSKLIITSAVDAAVHLS